MALQLRLTLNGSTRTARIADPQTPLLYVLRNQFDLDGPKFGCGLGQCGACMVLLEGKAVRSCLVAAASVNGKTVVTVEGLGGPAHPPPVQRAFIEEQAAQCGYCTSGMIVAATALLNRNPTPNEGEIQGALAGNLCRCGTHARIIRAVKRAAGEPAP
jgi:nicotinate dehydrogenase subunit A